MNRNASSPHQHARQPGPLVSPARRHASQRRRLRAGDGGEEPRPAHHCPRRHLVGWEFYSNFIQIRYEILSFKLDIQISNIHFIRIRRNYTNKICQLIS